MKRKTGKGALIILFFLAAALFFSAGPDKRVMAADVSGRVAQTADGAEPPNSSGATVVSEKMDIGHKILDFISDPSVAYMLLLLGIYGLFFEFANPGALFPGITGGIFLILAFFPSRPSR